MNLKSKIIGKRESITPSDLDVNFPLESFTIKQVVDYVIEHCVVNANQFRFFKTGSKDSPVYSNPATYSADSDYDLGLYRGMGSIPLDRKEKGWYITYNGSFLLGALTRQYTGDRLIRNEIKHGWDMSRLKDEGNFYIGYFDGQNYYVRKFFIVNSDMKELIHPNYKVKIRGSDFLEMNAREINDEYFPDQRFLGYPSSLKSWKTTSFIETMVHFKLDPDLFYSNLFHFINWPLDFPKELI